MIADLKTNEFLSIGVPEIPEVAAAVPIDTQIMHEYGRVNIGSSPAQAPEARTAAGAPSPANTRNLSLTERLGVAAFNVRVSQEYASTKESRSYAGRSWGSEEDDDGPSPIHIPDDNDSPDGGAEAQMPSLSQRMTGRIALGLVIVSGSETHLKFSISQQTKVVAEVQHGLSFLADQSPARDVTFVHEIQTPNVSAQEVTNGTTYEDFEAPWRDEALAVLGFTSGNAGARAYAAHLRTTLNTDWAYIAFFTRYRLKHFAYARLGGPKLVMHYDNDGWGSDQIDRVFAHETGHIFNAPDEYASANCNCGGSWGVFGRPNSNCASCAPNGGVKCIMKSNDWSMCNETPYHLGYNGLPQLATS